MDKDDKKSEETKTFGDVTFLDKDDGITLLELRVSKENRVPYLYWLADDGVLGYMFIQMNCGELVTEILEILEEQIGNEKRNVRQAGKESKEFYSTRIALIEKKKDEIKDSWKKRREVGRKGEDRQDEEIAEI